VQVGLHGGQRKMGKRPELPSQIFDLGVLNANNHPLFRGGVANNLLLEQLFAAITPSFAGVQTTFTATTRRNFNHPPLREGAINVYIL